MRLWSLHPSLLDAKGLVALWREGLLARHVLCGLTRGYRNHPQLNRFRELSDPIGGIDCYLHGVVDEATRRGYRFDRSKLPPNDGDLSILCTSGQIDFEVTHLASKLTVREPDRLPILQRAAQSGVGLVHPLFSVVAGDREGWEKG